MYSIQCNDSRGYHTDPQCDYEIEIDKITLEIVDYLTPDGDPDVWEFELESKGPEGEWFLDDVPARYRPKVARVLDDTKGNAYDEDVCDETGEVSVSACVYFEEMEDFR
jgi:hypothetical protein